MTEPYSPREIELLFRSINDKLDGLTRAVELKHVDMEKRLDDLIDATAKRFVAVEEDVKKLNNFQARAMTVWAVAVTAIGFFLNKL